MSEDPQTPFRLNRLSGEPLPAAEPGAVAVQTATFPDLGPAASRGAPAAGPGVDIRMLNDIPLEVTVELGRAVLTVRELLALRTGSLVELPQGAGTVDVVVNGRLVARGDVVVVDDDFGVRVTEIIDPAAAGRDA